jgi:hypothetical protein
MIRDVERRRAFERELSVNEKPDYAENLRLVEGMYVYARRLGRFSAEDALDGIEKNIRLAAVLHRVRKSS